MVFLESLPYAISNGARIHWEERGAGDPLLLIMGLGYTHEMWHRTQPVLASRYRTIVFDNRGVGRSDVPPGPYTIAQMAADAAAVLDAAGVERAHVFGISMGGMIAQEFALSVPDRVNALVLGCTAPGGRGAVPAKDNVLQVLMARATMTPEEDLAIRRRTYPTAAGYLAQIQAIMAWTSLDRLSDIRARTLVIHGEADELVPPENARILARLIPGARLEMLPHASHIFPTDQPEISHRKILEFLEQQA